MKKDGPYWVLDRGDNAGHAREGDKLPHVPVGMNDDAQMHAVHGGVPIHDANFALEILPRDG